MNLSIEEGLADVFMAGFGHNCGSGAKGYFMDSAAPFPRIDAVCEPLPPYFLNYFYWEDDITQEPKFYAPWHTKRPESKRLFGWCCHVTDCPVVTPPKTYYARMVEEVYLNTEVEGQGVITSPDFTYSWNPQLCYVSEDQTELSPAVHSNEVVMAALPCPGWAFSHWEIFQDGQWYGDFADNTLTIFMNHWGENNILHIPEGRRVKYVKAVFESLRKAITAMGGEFSDAATAALCCIADAPLEELHYDVTHIHDTGAKECILEELPNNSVFRFAGHGIAGGCIRVGDQSAIFGDPSETALCSSEISGNYNYELVLLNACRSGETTGFKSALNADCFIGWHGSPVVPFAVEWEKKFWKLVLAGEPVRAAAYEAQDDTIEELPQYPAIWDIVVEGNIIKLGCM